MQGAKEQSLHIAALDKALAYCQWDLTAACHLILLGILLGGYSEGVKTDVWLPGAGSGHEEWLLMGTGFLLGVMKNVLELDSVQNHWIVHFN